MKFNETEYVCPCQISHACQPNCSCVNPFMSNGCLCCAKYGSDEQQKKASESKIKMKKYAPAGQAELVMFELPFDEGLSRILNQDQYVDVVTEEGKLRVNFGASRLRAIKKSPKCACCGIRPTHCSIDIDAESSKKSTELVYHVNFYALSGVQGKDQQHMILFTKDHIIPKSKGGEDTEENEQVLCFNCNTLKLSASLSLEEMQHALFPAYRAYQSSKSLRLAKSSLQPLYRTLVGNDIAINKITQALNIVKDEQKSELEAKRKRREVQKKALAQYILDFEIEAQKTGIVPSLDKIDIRLILQKLQENNDRSI